MCHRRATLSHVCRSLVERLDIVRLWSRLPQRFFYCSNCLGQAVLFFDWYLLINTLWLHSHLWTTTHIIIRKYLLLSGPFDHAFGHGELSLQTCINGFEDGSWEVRIIMKVQHRYPIQSIVTTIFSWICKRGARTQSAAKSNQSVVHFCFVVLEQLRWLAQSGRWVGEKCLGFCIQDEILLHHKRIEIFWIEILQYLKGFWDNALFFKENQ